jgi:hypothetical protein
MDDRTIARWRLSTQKLAEQSHPSPGAAVDSLLGVQAENYTQTVWALAERSPGLTDEAFGQLIDRGEILRTHILRSTWHFVRPDDIVWLTQLTAPRVRRSLAQLQRSLQLDDATLEATDGAIVEILAAREHLTRDEMGERLRERGFPADGQKLGAMAFHAEISGLICSGVRKVGTQTYALIDERAPDARRLDRDEALAEVALRYFTGHGPATERDLSYWATLTISDVRAGLAAVADRLDSFEHDGRIYWYGESSPGDGGSPGPRGHLLLILDEYYRGYQDSRHVLDTDRLEPPGTRAVGMALVDGQLVGDMRRTLRSGSVVVDVGLYRDLQSDERTALGEAAERYGSFLGLTPELVIRRP